MNPDIRYWVFSPLSLLCVFSIIINPTQCIFLLFEFWLVITQNCSTSADSASFQPISKLQMGAVKALSSEGWPCNIWDIVHSSCDLLRHIVVNFYNPISLIFRSNICNGFYTSISTLKKSLDKIFYFVLTSL